MKNAFLRQWLEARPGWLGTSLHKRWLWVPSEVRVMEFCGILKWDIYFSGMFHELQIASSSWLLSVLGVVTLLKLIFIKTPHTFESRCNPCLLAFLIEVALVVFNYLHVPFLGANRGEIQPLGVEWERHKQLWQLLSPPGRRVHWLVEQVLRLHGWEGEMWLVPGEGLWHPEGNVGRELIASS